MVAVQEVPLTASSQQGLIEQFIAAYNAFDIEAMVALLSTDVCFENYSGDDLTTATNGRDEFRKVAEQSKLLFSEREQRISSIHFDQGIAIVTIEYRGKFARDVPSGPRAGEMITLRGTSEYSFRAGRICKIIDRS
jgi:steroid delta-isomerase-like uncharacterized protein